MIKEIKSVEGQEEETESKWTVALKTTKTSSVEGG